MVCKHCGNQLSLEDEVCPFCGMENEAAKKHIEEMRHFSGQFHQVKKEAIEETGKIKSYMPWLVLIGVLAAANVLVLTLLENVYWVEDRIEKLEVQLQEDSYYDRLCELEAKKDYVALGFCYVGENFYHSKRLREFAAVADAGETYGKLVESLGVIAAYQQGLAGEEDLDEKMRSFGDTLQRLYEVTDGEYYSYLTRYSGEKHEETLSDIREETEALLTAICGCSEEELEQMRTMKASELSALIQGKIRRERIR